MKIYETFEKWFMRSNVLRDEINILKMQNEDLQVNNEILKKEINVLKKQNEDLQVDNEIADKEIKIYIKKIEDIKNGKLKLIDEVEKKQLEDEVAKIEKAYGALQDMLAEEELQSGICNDGISDYYYNLYYLKIKAFKKALENGFRLNEKLPSVEEIEQVNKHQKNKFIEKAIRLGCYL